MFWLSKKLSLGQFSIVIFNFFMVTAYTFSVPSLFTRKQGHLSQYWKTEGWASNTVELVIYILKALLALKQQFIFCLAIVVLK